MLDTPPAVVPEGDCPLWLEFLDTVTGGDHALVAYLQRVCGYCLTGLTVEHVLFSLHGASANGKSVFIQTIAGVLWRLLAHRTHRNLYRQQFRPAPHGPWRVVSARGW